VQQSGTGQGQFLIQIQSEMAWLKELLGIKASAFILWCNWYLIARTRPSNGDTGRMKPVLETEVWNWVVQQNFFMRLELIANPLPMIFQLWGGHFVGGHLRSGVSSWPYSTCLTPYLNWFHLYRLCGLFR